MNCTSSSRITTPAPDPCGNNALKDHGKKELPQGDGLIKKTSTLPKKNRPTSTRFLGVRQRASGRWVAEIKDSSQKLRLWLGTFDKAEEAAMAYDSAARLLRGRNAKTNFPFHQTIKTHETKSSLLLKNPRFHQLLQHGIMRNHAKPSYTGAHVIGSHQNLENESGLIDLRSCVHETIVCSSESIMDGGLGCHGSQEKGLSGFPLGVSKVHSSVVVAPSFSLALYPGEEGMRCGETQSHQSQCLQADLLLENGFV